VDEDLADEVNIGGGDFGEESVKADMWVPFEFLAKSGISWKSVREDSSSETWDGFEGRPELRGKDLEPDLVDSTCTSKVGMREKRSNKLEDLASGSLSECS